MIISASRRTDIPAFYADWFMKRVRTGFFYRVNPFNSRQVTGFSLKAADVDAVCFWTKNPQPLMKHLDELDGCGLNYYFHFTLNPYDQLFEPGVPPLRERIDTMTELAGRIGPERVIWRYDPLILSSVTPLSWHLERVDQLSGLLAGATRRLMFSFYDFYGRGDGRLSRALAGRGITLHDIAAAEFSVAREQVARGFKAAADRHALEIFTCCETADLSGIPHGACIDAALVSKLFDIAVTAGKDKNQRAACGCVEAVDMGMYNSCRFRCRYCYANFNEATIESNCRKHHPDSPALLNEYGNECRNENGGEFEIRTRIRRDKKVRTCDGCAP